MSKIGNDMISITYPIVKSRARLVIEYIAGVALLLALCAVILAWMAILN